MQLTIPTTDEIRAAVRDELAAFFSANPFSINNEPGDEFGGVELAARVTGLSIATIRTKAHKREIPFSKPADSKILRFCRRELEDWMRTGKRRTRAELAEQAEIFQSKTQKTAVRAAV